MADNNRNQANSGESRSEQESLKRREYRGPNGEIHHHTRTYMEQHGGSKRGENQDKQKNGDRSTR